MFQILSVKHLRGFWRCFFSINYVFIQLQRVLDLSHNDFYVFHCPWRKAKIVCKIKKKNSIRCFPVLSEMKKKTIIPFHNPPDNLLYNRLHYYVLQKMYVRSLEDLIFKPYLNQLLRCLVYWNIYFCFLFFRKCDNFYI